MDCRLSQVVVDAIQLLHQCELVPEKKAIHVRVDVAVHHVHVELELGGAETSEEIGARRACPHPPAPP